VSQKSNKPVAEATVGASEARRFSGRANVLMSSLLVVAIALMLNYLAFRHYQRWDWTTAGSFTLSERTETVLRDLPADVEVYLVMSSAEGNYQDLRELLERYRAISQHVVLHFVDPDREPSEYQLVRERFHLGNAMLASGAVGSDVAIVLVSAERQWEITRDDLVTFDFDAYAEDGETVVSPAASSRSPAVARPRSASPRGTESGRWTAEASAASPVSRTRCAARTWRSR
jgi:ABC-2 type transport system permease protein